MKIESRIKGVSIVARKERGNTTAYQVLRCSGHSCAAATESSTRTTGFKPEQALFNIARNRGWAPQHNGKHLCPECQGFSRKKKGTTTMTDSKADIRQMLLADKRRVFRAIDEVYDEKHVRYEDGHTDHSVAKALAVPRKWVQDVREESFGPSGENTDMERLVSNLARLSHELTAAITKCMDAAAEAEKLGVQIEEARKQLDQIKAAVGPYRAA